ncbi:MAG: SGNH/GDSL hydrolase family protein [Fibrobacteria bacterium]
MKILPATLPGIAIPMALYLFASIVLTGCFGIEEDAGSGPVTVDWDTAFVLDGTELSRASSAVVRSQVRSGTRGRMDAFYRKCEAGGEVRIGFIGGSITEGALAGDLGNRYSSRFCRFLSRRFPNSRISEINAGIGSTTSRYGCSRVQSDLLSKSPDMVVIEYAVNDNPLDSALVMATMEGLIRKCLVSADSPVLLFQTMNRNGDSLNHRYQVRLADHYDVPVISYRQGLFPEISVGRLKAESIFADNVHPNAMGHLAGAYLLYAAVAGMYPELSSQGKPVWPITPVPAPFSTDFYARAGLLEAGDSTIRLLRSSGWTQGNDARGREIFSADSTGAFLEFECPADEMVIGYRVRKDLNATIEMTVDGKSVESITNGFPEDWGGGFTQFRLAYGNPPSHALHKVGLRLSSGGFVIIEALLYAGK